MKKILSLLLICFTTVAVVLMVDQVTPQLAYAESKQQTAIFAGHIDYHGDEDGDFIPDNWVINLTPDSPDGSKDGIAVGAPGSKKGDKFVFDEPPFSRLARTCRMVEVEVRETKWEGHIVYDVVRWVKFGTTK